MKAAFGIIVVVVVVAVAGSIPTRAQTKGASKTWTGIISDSNCKDKPHSAAEHEGKKMTEADCVGVCVKKGAKYVFVADGTVYQLANQKSKQIATHAGHRVELTGELKGDTINATTLKMAGK